MGMIGNYTAITREQLGELINTPSQIPSFLYPDPLPQNAKKRKIFLPKWLQKNSEHAQTPPSTLDIADLLSIDIDKAWHGIHFTLTGDPDGGNEPLANAVLGGKEIGEDIGYGPVRYLTPEQVVAVADALDLITAEIFESKLDYAAMEKNDIYPTIWDEGKEAGEYLTEYYDEVRSFFQKAREAEHAVLCYIN